MLCCTHQGAVPQILEKTDEEYFSKIIGLLRETADICYDKIKEIPCITRPNKPEGSMFIMVWHQKYIIAIILSIVTGERMHVFLVIEVFHFRILDLSKFKKIIKPCSLIV